MLNEAEPHSAGLRYKISRQIEFRNEIPVSNVGKVLRRVLRDEAHQK